IADAIHSVSDLFTDAVVLFGLQIGRKAADETHPFGHRRFETLASSVVGISLIAVALMLGYKAALNIYFHVEYKPNWLAVAIATLSIGVKEILYQLTLRAGRKIKSSAVTANAWHHRSDAMSSIAVLIGVTGAQLRPGWHILDSYAALAVTIMIIKVGLDILIEAVREFTDTAPGPEIQDKIKQCALSVSGVFEVHDLKIRTSGGLMQMEIHISIDGEQTVKQGHQIAKEVESCLLDDLDNLHQVIVHVDPV
ncbi:MAG TPA: cation transporter, partial [Desulfobacteraceae bacterium]|nr:cation transporter [Desulfobacteraceae bacterium]